MTADVARLHKSANINLAMPGGTATTMDTVPLPTLAPAGRKLCMQVWG